MVVVVGGGGVGDGPGQCTAWCIKQSNHQLATVSSGHTLVEQNGVELASLLLHSVCVYVCLCV